MEGRKEESAEENHSSYFISMPLIQTAERRSKKGDNQNKHTKEREGDKLNIQNIESEKGTSQKKKKERK